jgi:hypothetical protein
MPQRRIGGTESAAPRILKFGTRRSKVVSFKPQPLYPAGKLLVNEIEEVVWAPGRGEQILAPTGNQTRSSSPKPSHCTDWVSYLFMYLVGWLVSQSVTINRLVNWMDCDEIHHHHHHHHNHVAFMGLGFRWPVPDVSSKAFLGSLVPVFSLCILSTCWMNYLHISKFRSICWRIQIKFNLWSML